jgi:hypothetical protein
MDRNPSSEVPANRQDEAPNTVTLPSPTAWPIVLAFGITLVFTGMLSTWSVSILGVILALCGIVGWFRDVLPFEKHETVPAVVEPLQVFTSRPVIARANWITHDPHRVRLPLETYPVSAGVKGGLAGSVVMAVLAIAYGWIAWHSPWSLVSRHPGRVRHRCRYCRFQATEGPHLAAPSLCDPRRI